MRKYPIHSGMYKKGHIPWHTGTKDIKKHTEETKQKISLSKKGHSIHHERQFKKGAIPWNKGKHPQYVQKENHPMYGKKHTEESKLRMGLPKRGKKHTLEHNLKIQNSAVKGKKHWNWKGGIVPLAHMIRICFKYRQWRSDVFQRDNYTCLFCNKRGGHIEADHYPKSFSNIFHANNIKTLEDALACEEFWNINNGRTLCYDCHKKTNNYLNN